MKLNKNGDIAVMEKYDPSIDINASVWLAIDENDRMDMIEEYVETEDHIR